MRRFTTGLLASALLAGCTVGPDYHEPVMQVPAKYAQPHAVDAVPGAQIDPATWWTAFGDPLLTSLVERSLKGNPSIEIAASRVRQARLQEIQARAVGKPTVAATGNVTHIEFSKNAGFASLARLFGGSGGTGGSSGGGTGGGAGTGGSGSGSSGGVALPGSGITTYALGFDASWELDLFGGGRRGVQAARANTDAAVWNQRDAAVTLAAEVADAYFALRLDQAQVAVIQDELRRQRRALEIANHVSRVGLTPQIDVVRQRASITSTEARLQPIQADIQLRAHALGTLLGTYPEALYAELYAPAPALRPAPLIPAGLPSDLLRRRPDIRAAERNLAAATANIGVAVADLYPHFSLTGMAELISSALSTLFQGDSLQLTGTAAGTFPILDWGRREATVGIRKEDRQQAYLNYQATVLQGFRDVEDALAQIANERQRITILQSAVVDAERTRRAVEAQYLAGLIAQDPLLNAEVQVLTAREQLTQGQAQLRQDSVALFKAIGGGWQVGQDPQAGDGQGQGATEEPASPRQRP